LPSSLLDLFVKVQTPMLKLERLDFIILRDVFREDYICHPVQ